MHQLSQRERWLSSTKGLLYNWRAVYSVWDAAANRWIVDKLFMNVRKELSWKLACWGPFSLEIISSWVNFQILKSDFFGVVVQLTYVFQNDVIKAVTTTISVACFKTLQWTLHLHLFKRKSFKHLPDDGIFAFALLNHCFGKHLTQRKCSYDVQEFYSDHVVRIKLCNRSYI